MLRGDVLLFFQIWSNLGGYVTCDMNLKSRVIGGSATVSTCVVYKCTVHDDSDFRQMILFITAVSNHGEEQHMHKSAVKGGQGPVGKIF